MIGKRDIFEVREQIKNYVGSKVRIRANKGRKKITINEGVIQSTYPSIFVVKIEGDNIRNNRTVSYSYTDVLTHTVELSLCQDN